MKDDPGGVSGLILLGFTGRYGLRFCHFVLVFMMVGLDLKSRHKVDAFQSYLFIYLLVYFHSVNVGQVL